MFDCIRVVVWHVGLRNIYMREAEGMCSPVIGGFSRDLNKVFFIITRTMGTIAKKSQSVTLLVWFVFRMYNRVLGNINLN